MKRFYIHWSAYVIFGLIPWSFFFHYHYFTFHFFYTFKILFFELVLIGLQLSSLTYGVWFANDEAIEGVNNKGK